MAMNDSVYSRENAKESDFSEGFQNNESSNTSEAPLEHAWTKADGQEEHLNDPDEPCRSALMDCYNR